VKAGAVCDVPAAHVDLFPTLLEICGAKRPEGQVLDGVSLLPLLRAGGEGALGRDAIYWHFPGYLESYIPEATWRTTPAGAIRSGDWKLLEFFEDGRVELYDLRRDIGETRDLAADMPEKARELREKLAAWRKALGAAMPVSRAR
jgi:arylsulfatase A-like enzyme